MTGKKKGCLIALLVLLVLLATGVGVGVSMIPGGAKSVSVQSITRGAVRYQLPDELWRREVVALFPLTESVADLVKLRLSNPQFIADPDPAWLRLRIELNAAVNLGTRVENYPGHVEMRTQLRLDPKKRAVVLSKAELVDFTLSGDAAATGASLQKTLADAFAAELDDYPIFELPKSGAWWQRTGAGMVRDVLVEGGKVTVVTGW